MCWEFLPVKFFWGFRLKYSYMLKKYTYSLRAGRRLHLVTVTLPAPCTAEGLFIPVGIFFSTESLL
jgi:hypothetical protein